MRLRLGRAEVERVAAGETVSEETHFSVDPPVSLRYAVRAEPRAFEISATFVDGAILVTVPYVLTQEWATTQAVTLEGSQAVGDRTLSVLVEKDFTCLMPRSTEDHDGFPNPNAV